MKSLVDHIENYLGTIDSGWSDSADGDSMFFQIAKCVSRSGDVAYSTLGLSKIPLRSEVSGNQVRQELFILVPVSFGDRNIPAVLQNVTAEAIGLKRAYLRGEVIGPRGNLFDGLPFTALYVTIPVCLPQGLQEFRDAEGQALVFAWLVPITETEANFIAARGWKEFENLLEERNADLVNLARPAVA
ncbi:MAG: suppressor of fused domain protein [Acidobacteria bacterium]|nr:suppressor of fused domain protein [Acidobacteriota bacterium]